VAEQEVFRVRDERKPGHHWADNEVLDLYARDLGAFGYAVYMALGRHSDNRTGRCSKSQKEIAAIFGCSADTVQRAIARMIELRLVTKEEIVGKPCVYILLEVEKQRNVPRGQNNLPLPAVTPAAVSGNHLPLSAAPLPLPAVTPAAVSGDPAAVSGDPIRKQDSYKTEQDSSQSSSAVGSLRNGNGDPRFEGLKERISFWYRAAFEKGSCPWSKRDLRALQGFLQQLPSDWTVEMLERCVVHWCYSKRSAPEAPHVFLSSLLRFSDSPRDRFDNPDDEERAHCTQLIDKAREMRYAN
jgi:DNA-binding MarR family transcriptional regulator